MPMSGSPGGVRIPFQSGGRQTNSEERVPGKAGAGTGKWIRGLDPEPPLGDAHCGNARWKYGIARSQTSAPVRGTGGRRKTGGRGNGTLSQIRSEVEVATDSRERAGKGKYRDQYVF